MVRAIMHGCNGKMGQVITGLAAADDNIEIVAGIDVFDDGHNSYPVFPILMTAMSKQMLLLILLQPKQSTVCLIIVKPRICRLYSAQPD